MENKLAPIEHGGQRVLTTKQLAEVYEANEQQIQQNYNNHESQFEEGVHYILLKGAELKEFKRCFDDIEEALGVSKFTSSLYLWTERGANRHCKILDTSKAWEQFDNLEETYFAVKEQRAYIGAPKSAMEYLRIQSAAMLELDDRVTDLEDKVEHQMTIDHGQQRRLQQIVGERVYERAANVLPPKEVKANVGPFFKAIYKDLKNRFGVPSYRDIRPADYQAAVAYVEAWIEPAEVQRARRASNGEGNYRLQGFRVYRKGHYRI
ncbi:MAG: ORF6N domain-containing protein [Pseudoflavonifractor sp.]|nr:ORF6N domain-containing protein [Pseudoflavonifractor sp.]